ncbi:mechanosensitive ion channel domain-containing protein [Vibrio sp. STUT-A11]|uniref:mechanosensitive ion channel family protein n=1 Tax=unclassified Vibrio TaxID=2614977 RepID=UPI00222FA240|nr:mechanosensitive ion channel domain-containing protein [Vibrio sp. STUT-A11]BDR12621.1 mechanosensitive ion channel protein [Vibrio sp. STUT-A11]
MDYITDYYHSFLDSVSSTETYSQIGIILCIYLLAFIVANRVYKYAPILRNPPLPASNFPIRHLIYRCGKLLFPILAIVLLRLSLEFSQFYIEDGWVIKVAFAVAVLLLFHSFISLVITNPLVATVFRWIGMPIIIFYGVGVLDDIIDVLESMSINLGNIHISAYGLARTLIFGSLLFWLGRVSNATGQTIIRKQKSLDFRTREIVAKVFEVALFFTVILLILQLMGINLTTLAVFGGAVGVGLGFGLQAIASNFISGIIIIFDRSISVGDYIELEDGRTGVVTELNMRSTTLETFDGKDIVVPNEKFISSSFTNWTHKNTKQRYRVDFSVAYKTDVRSMVELIKEAVASHPQVLSGPKVPFEERPDCEIDSFGDSGINMFVEFWMEGIDDGRNRVGGDLLLIILETLQDNGIEIPFPQRDIRVVSTDDIDELHRKR